MSPGIRKALKFVLLKHGASPALLAAISAIIERNEPPPPPPPPQYPYDYADPKYATAAQVYGAFPNGLPLDWSWDDWCAVTGNPDPRTHDNQGNPIDPPDGGGSHWSNNLDVVQPATQKFTAGVAVTYTFTGDGARKKMLVFGVSGYWFNNVLQSTLVCQGVTVFDHREPMMCIEGYESEPFECSGPCTYTVALDQPGDFAAQIVAA